MISLKVLPSKLNLSSQHHEQRQVRGESRLADALGTIGRKLIEYCVSPAAKSNPSDKIVKNLCAFVCQDTTRVAIFAASQNVKEGIMSMNEPVVVPKGPGRTSTKDEAVESEEVMQGKLIRRGAAAALAQLAEVFGEKLFEVCQCCGSA